MSQQIDLTQSEDECEWFPYQINGQESQREGSPSIEEKYREESPIVPEEVDEDDNNLVDDIKHDDIKLYEEYERDTGIECDRPATGVHKDPFHGRKFRWWFITWNNPKHPEDKEKLLKEKIISYVKFQYEKGKSGTPHYQGVFYLKNPNTCSGLRKHFPGCGYMAPVKDTKGAITYCGKSESRLDGPWERGTPPKQGARSDLLVCKEIVDGGGRMEDLFEQSFSNAVRYGRGLQSYINLVDKKQPRSWQTTCYVYAGDARIGKSEAVKEEVQAWGGKTFWLTLEGGNMGKVWWDGYDGEPNVVIDEFEQQIRLGDLKRIIDSTPYKVPIKGGHVELKARRVWIMSNSLPETWYRKAAPEGTAQRDALMARLHYVEKFLKVENGGLGKWQGQATFSEYQDSRWSFVEAQKDGSYNIDTRGPGQHPGPA